MRIGSGDTSFTMMQKPWFMNQDIKEGGKPNGFGLV